MYAVMKRLLDHHQTDIQHMTPPAAVPALHGAILAHLNEAFDSPEMLISISGPVLTERG